MRYRAVACWSHDAKISYRIEFHTLSGLVIWPPHIPFDFWGTGFFQSWVRLQTAAAQSLLSRGSNCSRSSSRSRESTSACIALGGWGGCRPQRPFHLSRFVSIRVTTNLNRRAGVMWNSLAASAIALRSSGAATVPRCLPPFPMKSTRQRASVLRGSSAARRCVCRRPLHDPLSVLPLNSGADAPGHLSPGLVAVPEVSQNFADTGKHGKPYDVVVHNTGHGSCIQPIAAMSSAFDANVVGSLLAAPPTTTWSKACAAVVNRPRPNAVARFDFATKNLAATSSAHIGVPPADRQQQLQQPM
jgi:hypothetical protein